MMFSSPMKAFMLSLMSRDLRVLMKLSLFSKTSRTWLAWSEFSANSGCFKTFETPR